MSDDRKLLTKRQVATLLQVSPYTIDAWVSQRRELTFVRVGRCVRFDMKDVQAWIDRNRVQPE